MFGVEAGFCGEGANSLESSVKVPLSTAIVRRFLHELGVPFDSFPKPKYREYNSYLDSSVFGVLATNSASTLARDDHKEFLKPCLA